MSQFKSIAVLVIYIVFISFLIYWKYNAVPQEVVSTLKSAGGNKTEFLKIIEHYKKIEDEKKLAAAYYTISNMRDLVHFEGESVEGYDTFFNTIERLPVANKFFIKTWDSLTKIYTAERSQKTMMSYDINSINADLIIQHIDAAFEAWNYKWARHLSFSDFCEYILPYKVANEKPELWNKEIQQKYQWLTDSMGASESVMDACLYLNKNIKKNFWINSLFTSTWDFGYKNLNKVFDKVHTRGCYYSAQYSTYILRAMGVPVAIDYTPYWANMSSGHEWNALLYNGKPIPFIGTESDPGKTKVEAAFSRKRAKVFRRTFAIQRTVPIDLVNPADVPDVFKDTHIRDVTSDYEPVSNVRVKLNRKVSTAPIAFICVYNGQDWKPVYWGKVEDIGSCDFKDMGRGIVYLPMYFENSQFIPAGEPLILDKSGKINFLSADTSKVISIRVESKSFDGVKIKYGGEYELFYWDPIFEWTSLGRKKALSTYLEFSDVPQNALYFLHNEEKPETVRIFTYGDGKQKFW